MNNSIHEWVVSVGCATLFAACLATARASAAAPATYETGFNDIIRISVELHQALEGKQRQLLHPTPVFCNQMSMPMVQPGLSTDGTNTWRAVHVSAGFVDFINFFSHARAIDITERGYLKKFLAGLANETGDRPLADIRPFLGPHAWSFDTMNHQVSHFNQMVGALVAIDMAHHYLGHYDKYAAQLVDPQNRPVPIAAVVTADEWRNAVLKGARNALDCGLGVEGLKSLLDAMDKMPTRPAWTLFFVPYNSNAAKLRRELERMEKDFFLMK